jgi:hypothetical protein
METKRRKEIMTWLLDFAQMDLDSLPEQEKIILGIRLKSFLAERVFLKTEPKLGELDRFDVQYGWGFAFEEIKGIQKALLEYIFDVMDGPHRPGEPSSEVPSITRFLTVDEKGRYKFMYADLSGSGRGDAFKSIWAELLIDLKQPILKCQECGRYFLSTSKRVKRFCSSKCMWREGARRKRKKLRQDPEAYEKYKEKQKGIMQDYYAKKKRGNRIAPLKITKKKTRKGR